ncbi:ubiquinol-cytochrome c reductase iron-sulfur subunit [Gulosibacter sp. 10]|uniref:QcrA and Rieske domain-containing protein n=1 Tax=Gulosibacter sp. 10 TaxID=1255570 RepID=UPI00097E87B9|nr:Rieske (2Fe-2S) protein [Gulosibacter sp. 10]SJM56627.1 putative iron sulphur protein [Gulosibacter sp. 10]
MNSSDTDRRLEPARPAGGTRGAAAPSCGGACGAPSRRAFLRASALAGGGTALALLLSACAEEGVEPGETAEPFDLPAAEVPVGGGVVLRDREVVVTQPAAGEYAAFGAICTHQGCVLSDVRDRGAHCGCHGSFFDIATGDPVAGPAQRPLPAIPIRLEGDTLRIGEPSG